jgi:hypothetical protein
MAAGRREENAESAATSSFRRLFALGMGILGQVVGSEGAASSNCASWVIDKEHRCRVEYLEDIVSQFCKE